MKRLVEEVRYFDTVKMCCKTQNDYFVVFIYLILVDFFSADISIYLAEFSVALGPIADSSQYPDLLFHYQNTMD